MKNDTHAVDIRIEIESFYGSYWNRLYAHKKRLDAGF